LREVYFIFSWPKQVHSFIEILSIAGSTKKVDYLR
jgi:hypothetical protein